MFISLFRALYVAFTLTRYMVIPSRSSVGVSLSNAFQDLGSVFVKLGQFLALRGDMIGYENSKDLSGLYDNVKPFSYNEFFESLKTELNADPLSIFQELSDTPAAAASISQVHKARLQTGEYVAVKVLRPKVRALFNQDISIMLFIARILTFVVKKSRRLKLVEFVYEFQEICKFEMDLLFEAANMSELRDNVHNKNGIRVPEIYWNLTTSNMIVMEWVDAKPIYCYFGSPLGSKLAEIIVNSFCDQVYENKFFHADMHPGNIMVDSANNVIYIDLGIACRLDNKTSLYVLGIFTGFLNGDYEMVADIHFEAGYVKKDRERFISACRIIGEPFMWKDMKSFSPSGLLARLFKVTEDFGMETQIKLILLQKSMLIVESLCRNLDPDCNMWQITKTWVDKNFSGFKKYKLQIEMLDLTKSLRRIDSILKKVEELLFSVLDERIHKDS